MVQIEAAFWGALVRVGQALMEASPTLLCGLIVAGVFRHILGAEGTRRLFGSNGWTRLPRAWGLGMVLPLCSLGVIPILHEMRRARISTGTMLAFALAAPLFNPISLLYGLTLSQPFVIFCFTFISLIIVTILGTAWDRIFPASHDEETVPDERSPADHRRLLAVVGAAARATTGPSSRYWLAALGGVALLSVVLPAGILQKTMSHSDMSSPLLMAAVALPAYVSPIKVMTQLGLIFEHGNSVGAALTLLILGAGANLGTLIWIGRHDGWRAGLIWIGLLAGSVLPFAYLSEKPLYAALHEEPHTHAFDDFCSPFVTRPATGFATHAYAKLGEALDMHEVVCLGALGLLFIGGLFLRLADRRGWAWHGTRTAAPSAAPAASFLNRPLPTPVLAGAVLCGLVVFSVVACYLYYPPPQELFEQIRMVRTTALSAVLAGEREEAIREIERWDDLTRKLEVGVYLRTGRLPQDAHAATENLRESLEQIRDALIAGDAERARALVPEAQTLHAACRALFLPQQAISDPAI